MLKIIGSCFIIIALSFGIASANSDFESEFLESFESEFSDTSINIYDPLSGYNRAMTSFNDALYTGVLFPVVRGYNKVMPQPARKGLSNFFHNLLYPIRLVNNLLQFKIQNSIEETGRFLINSTFGILGFMDVAKSSFGLDRKNEDFGQTLGYWGVGSGPHIVLPFLGNSNLRDMFGLVGDGYLNPLSSSSYEPMRIPNNTVESVGLKVFETTNKLSHNPDVYEVATKDTIDLYIFLRDSYEQRRHRLIEE